MQLLVAFLGSHVQLAERQVVEQGLSYLNALGAPFLRKGKDLMEDDQLTHLNVNFVTHKKRRFAIGDN